MQRRSTWTLAALAVLMLAMPAFATFDATNPDQTPDQQVLSINAAGAQEIETLRYFTIANVADINVTAALTNVSGENAAIGSTVYSVDLFLSDDNGTTETQVGTAVTDTTASTEIVMNSTELGRLRAVFHLPENRTAGDLAQGFAITIGTETVTLAHLLEIYNYDPAVDSDADHLTDSWETANFGNLTAQTGDGDADGDGFTNAEEEEAGSDPNDANSTPNNVVISGGGGNVDDREIGIFTTGLLLFAMILFIGVLVAVDKAKGRKADENMVAIATVSIGGASLVAFLIVGFLDYFELGNINWAWWVHAGLGWEQWVAFAFAVVAILVAGSIVLMKTPQKKEKKAVIPFLLAIGVVVITAIVMFVWFDVPIPLT